MSKILIENIWAEDLFEWFYNHVQASGGDGAGAIVCENYKEVANWFIEWFCKKLGVKENGDWTSFDPFLKREHTVHLGEEKFWHPRHEYDNVVNFHDGNENFIFTDKEDIFLHDGDYIFIIKENCQFGFKSSDSNKIIKKV